MNFSASISKAIRAPSDLELGENQQMFVLSYLRMYLHSLYDAQIQKLWLTNPLIATTS